MKILARHKDYVAGATISESIDEYTSRRRFVATIRGYRNWIIYDGNNWDIKRIIAKVKEIRDEIDNGKVYVFKLPMPLIIDEDIK
jgi:hypothetical protein